MAAFKNVKGIMVDLSGTMHIEDQVVGHAKLALEKLRASGLPFLFVTNTTKELRSSLRRQLVACGLDIPEEQIYTSLLAAAKVIKERGIRPLLLVNDCAVEDLGVGDAAEAQGHDPNGVVIGWSPDKFTYENMNRAFQIVQEGGHFIAIHKSRFLRRSDARLHLGPGPFVTGLEFATGRRAEVVGKPEPAFFQGAAEQMGVSLSDAVMVGDDVETDVVGAQNAGMKAILVRTGKYESGDESRFQNSQITSCANILEAVELILSSRK